MNQSFRLGIGGELCKGQIFCFVLEVMGLRHLNVLLLGDATHRIPISGAGFDSASHSVVFRDLCKFIQPHRNNWLFVYCKVQCNVFRLELLHAFQK